MLACAQMDFIVNQQIKEIFILSNSGKSQLIKVY